MRNAECTPLTEAEAKELFSAFPKFLSDREEALARKFFEPYVFFRTKEKTVRRCVCTSCMEGFCADKEIHPDFFRVKHKGICECPNCGQRATLLAMGKYKNFQNLTSNERAVQISVHKDWLLVQAGRIFRRFEDEDLGGYLDFIPYRRYAFAPGRRVGWKSRTYSWFGRDWWADGMWERMERINAPFQNNRTYETEAAYFPIGVENITESSLRYCQYAEWFGKEYGCRIDFCDFEDDPFRVAHLVRYLAEYTQHPQMELLAKLGFHQVVSDLILHGKPHRDILDWNAQNPADFFRLSKEDFRRFRDAAGSFGEQRGFQCMFEELKVFRKLQKHGLVSGFEEFARYKIGWKRGFERACKGARLSGVSLERADRYLRSLDQGLETSAQLWADYLDAAVKLKYDLSRDDVRMPKDLAQRHDQATSAVIIAEDKKAMKRYQARYERLTEQFSFSADELCVVVPKGVQDIVREGRLLSHCVGGYAERHVNGAVTILFLRKASAPGLPYVTIQLTTQNNCGELQIVQIHGYRNEIGGRESPMVKHADFLKKWLDWVHAGSPRDQEGNPVIAEDAVSAA